MISIRQQKKLYTKDKMLFVSDAELNKIKTSADIINLFYSDLKECDGTFSIKNKVYSATNDITLDIETIRGKFSKTVRYEISRAEKENTAISYYSSSDLQKPGIIDSIKSAYFKFCEEKCNDSLKKYFSENEIKTVSEMGNVMVSCAKYDGGITYHIYYHDKCSSMLMFSFSNILDGSLLDKSEINKTAGRANKLLHWKDMLYFKDMGLKTYDWGGLFNPNGENGIDNFKLSFGSQPRDALNVIYGHTLLGKMLVFVYKLKNRGA